MLIESIQKLHPAYTSITYFAIIIVVVFLSFFLCKLCVALEKKTHLSGTMIGTIFLGIITSCPELITAISSVFIPPNKGFVAVGDIVGSNLFDLFVLAIFLIYFLLVKDAKKLDKANYISIGCMFANIIFCFLCGVLYKFVEVGILKKFNVFTIAFACLFLVNVFFLTKTSKKEATFNKLIKKNQNINHSIKTWPLGVVILLIVITAAALIVSNYFLTIFAMQINVYLNLDGAFGGAILLGIITSLPEIITCIALAKGGHLNMLVGNMIGSVNFNFLILFITNVILSCVYGNQMFSFFGDQESTSISWQILFLLIQNFSFLIYTICSTRKVTVATKCFKHLSLSIVALCYLGFISIGWIVH